MSIPIKPMTAEAIRRFPELYKRIATKAIQYEVSEAIRTTSDSFVMAAMLALIEEFDFGTTGDQIRLHRFLAKLQEIINVNAEFYDDAIAQGLYNKLHALGIDYRLGKGGGNGNKTDR